MNPVEAPQEERAERISALRLAERVPSWLLQRRTPRRYRLLLAQTPVFVNAQRRQLARAARWGDVIETRPGEVLVREDHTDFWFFVILAGSVRVTRRGRALATLHRGDHFGEIAIIGFRPQPATVTVVEPTILFVWGRRYLLSLAGADEGIQHALFPDLAPGGYSAFAREQLEEGHRYWKQLARPEQPSLRTGTVVPAPIARRPGRTLTWREAVDLLSHHELGRASRTAIPEPSAVSKRFKLLAATVVTSLAAAISLVYHPPLAVVTSGRTVDVVQDISVTGIRAEPPTGRYLLTPVDVDRPSLAGMLVAKARGLLVVRTNAPDEAELDPATARRLAHDAFVSSHRQATALAEKELGLDATRVTIAIRDRGITGPSAGLIYALAIADMLAPDDLADGRVIAATGELRADGGVGRVAFVSLKADAARDGGATVYLVPDGQQTDARGRGLTVFGVSSFKEAVRVLERD